MKKSKTKTLIVKATITARKDLPVTPFLRSEIELRELRSAPFSIFDNFCERERERDEWESRERKRESYFIYKGVCFAAKLTREGMIVDGGTVI